MTTPNPGAPKLRPPRATKPRIPKADDLREGLLTDLHEGLRLVLKQHAYPLHLVQEHCQQGHQPSLHCLPVHSNTAAGDQCQHVHCGLADQAAPDRIAPVHAGQRAGNYGCQP